MAWFSTPWRITGSQGGSLTGGFPTASTPQVGLGGCILYLEHTLSCGPPLELSMVFAGLGWSVSRSMIPISLDASSLAMPSGGIGMVHARDRVDLPFPEFYGRCFLVTGQGALGLPGGGVAPSVAGVAGAVSFIFFNVPMGVRPGPDFYWDATALGIFTGLAGAGGPTIGGSVMGYEGRIRDPDPRGPGRRPLRDPFRRRPGHSGSPRPSFNTPVRVSLPESRSWHQ